MQATVIIPCYNQGAYIEECLNSVKAQTINKWECVIVDDGSTDDSIAIIEKLVENDERFKVICQENGGVSHARNIAAENSSGKYILPLDADDYISSNYLEKAINILDKIPDCSLVYGNARFVGLKQGRWNLPDFTIKDLAISNLIYVSGVYRRVDFINIGGYDVSMKSGLEDWEFWIRLLKDNPCVHRLDEEVFYYRIKDISRNTVIKSKDVLEIQAYIYKKHVNFYVNTLGSIQDISSKLKYTENELNALRSSFFYPLIIHFNTLKKRVKRFLE